MDALIFIRIAVLVLAVAPLVVPSSGIAEEPEQGRDRGEIRMPVPKPSSASPDRSRFRKGRPFRRPFDDRDPEMKYLAQYYLAQGTCPTAPREPCVDAGKPLWEGGDRLARYLIAQYEASLDEGYPDTTTIVTAIGGTRSDTGLRYMERMIKKPRTPRERKQGLTGLARCNRDEAIDIALQVLRESQDVDDRRLAVKAISGNLYLLGHPRPDVEPVLEDIASNPEEGHYARSIAESILEGKLRYY